jgi:pimeloyl-ACP methyl ester carboxylesterase
MDQEQVDGAVLIGHSMGGSVMLQAALTLEHRALGVIGADTFKTLSDEPQDGPMADFLHALEVDFNAVAKDRITLMFDNSSPVSLKKSIRDEMLGTPSDVAISAMRGMIKSGPVLELARAVTATIVTINARNSPIDMVGAKEVGMEVRSVTTGGHFVMVEDPESFNRHLSEIIATIY